MDKVEVFGILALAVIAYLGFYKWWYSRKEKKEGE